MLELISDCDQTYVTYDISDPLVGLGQVARTQGLHHFI